MSGVLGIVPSTRVLLKSLVVTIEVVGSHREFKHHPGLASMFQVGG